MSDSIKKYHELVEEGRLLTQSPQQQAIQLITEVVRAAMCAGNLDIVLDRVVKMSTKNPNLTPRVVFDIVSEDMKVDELCTPQKQQQWNNRE